MKIFILTISLLLFLHPKDVFCQTEQNSFGHSQIHTSLDEGPRTWIPFPEEITQQQVGMVHFPLEGATPEVQTYFNWGMGLMYGYYQIEAERYFRKALQLLPNHPLIYFAMALNLTARGHGAHGQPIPERAKKLISLANKNLNLNLYSLSKLSLDLIKALESFYQQPNDVVGYILNLKGLVKKYPYSSEIVVIYVMEIWGEVRNHTLEYQQKFSTNVDELETLLQNRVLKKNPNHPAHHFRIHLHDEISLDQASFALQSTEYSERVNSIVPHQWHMNAHLNSFFDAEKNRSDRLKGLIRSAQLDHQRHHQTQEFPYFDPNYVHNNELLGISLIHEGYFDEAESFLRSMLRIPLHPKFNSLAFDYQIFTIHASHLMLLLELKQDYRKLYNLSYYLFKLVQNKYESTQFYGKILRGLGISSLKIDQIETFDMVMRKIDSSKDRFSFIKEQLYNIRDNRPLNYLNSKNAFNDFYNTYDQYLNSNLFVAGYLNLFPEKRNDNLNLEIASRETPIFNKKMIRLAPLDFKNIQWKRFPALELGSDEFKWVVFTLGESCQSCNQQIQQLNACTTYPVQIYSPDEMSLYLFKKFGVYDDFEDMPLHGLFLIDRENNIRLKEVSASAITGDDLSFFITEADRQFRVY